MKPYILDHFYFFVSDRAWEELGATHFIPGLEIKQHITIDNQWEGIYFGTQNGVFLEIFSKDNPPDSYKETQRPYIGMSLSQHGYENDDDFDEIEKKFPHISLLQSEMIKVEEGKNILWVDTLYPNPDRKKLYFWNMIWRNRFRKERRNAPRYYTPNSPLIFKKFFIEVQKQNLNDLLKEAVWPHVESSIEDNDLVLKMKHKTGQDVEFIIRPNGGSRIEIEFTLNTPMQAEAAEYRGDHIEFSTDGKLAYLKFKA